MSAEPTKNRRWQISLRTIMIGMAAVPMAAGLFYGTFGEAARQRAVWTLSQLSHVLLPAANTAILILIVLGTVAVARRLRSG